MANLLRNAPCACNSGLRYKHCCGSLAGETSKGPNSRRQAALILQKAGRSFEAIEAYDAILLEQGNDWEVAHMRALAYLQIGLLDDARVAFAALLSTPAVHFDGFWSNLGLLLASVCSDPLSVAVQSKLNAYRCMHPVLKATRAGKEQTACSSSGNGPSVSVVIPAYMHAGYVSEAIGSVFAQTRPPLELIVIDDGSTDGTAESCRAALASAPFPVTLIARENRGAATTLNQGIQLARGEYIQLLNSDDRLPADRIETMLDSLLERNAEWGFARVSFIDGNGHAFRQHENNRQIGLMAQQNAAVMCPTLGLAMLRANSAITSGNLMFRKSLWETLGGFHDYRYNHDWDFCLRATLESEPVLVPHSLYEYRIHERNTISESIHAPRLEQRKVMASFARAALNHPPRANRFSPTLANWGGEFIALLGLTEALQHLPIEIVEQALQDPHSFTIPIG